MAFQTAITIKRVLDGIHRHEYVLPAIQREFVWKPKQIARLFVSLMRMYPIGSFLVWKVNRDTSKQFKFYDFVRSYHQRDSPHCPTLSLTGESDVMAILDGQQRLTALNIGLRGSHTEKAPRLHWKSNWAFPTKHLYLNLLGEASDNEEGMTYDFRFLKEDQAQQRDETHFWFPVSKVMGWVESGPDINEYLIDNDLASSRGVFRMLDRLHSLVHRDQVVSYYLEEEQDIDKVLNIFIRVNSGGTVLSYSDLLLSIATAQWTKLDARTEIHALVDALNSTRNGFNVSKDFVLKAGLMLSDISSVGFRVTNFNAANMAVLENNWPRIDRTLRRTFQLAADFGFSGATLGADSALLPLAYFIFRHEEPDALLAKSKYDTDRRNMHEWLSRSLLKSGVWGSGLDTLLTAIRTAIKADTDGNFPRQAIEAVMARRGRSLRFEEDEVQDLADTTFGDKRLFPLLALLYPFMDLRNEFHIDHIFPRSRFTKKRLTDAGVSTEDLDTFGVNSDQIANLHLLDGVRNREKSDKMPAEWLEAQFPDPATRAAYCERHDLGDVPNAMTAFDVFYNARRDRVLRRLRTLLGVTRPSESPPSP